MPKGRDHPDSIVGLFIYNLFSTGNLAGSCGAQGETVCDLKSLETGFIAKNSLHSLTSPWNFAGEIHHPSIHPAIHPCIRSQPASTPKSQERFMECSAYLEIAGYSGSQFFLGENFFGTPKLVECFHGSGGFFRVTKRAPWVALFS